MDKDPGLPKPAASLNDSTLFDVVDTAQDKRGRIGRRIVLMLVALFILISLTNVFGMETTTTSGSPGQEIIVTAPLISRAGMDAKISMGLRTSKTISAPITITIDQDYLDGFSTYDISPAPDSESSDGTLLVLRYDAPQENSFRLDIDGTISEDGILQVTGMLGVYIDEELVASTKLKLWKAY